MSKLIMALPLPGVGAMTLASIINTSSNNVQAIAYFDFVIEDLAEEFEVHPNFLREHMNEPSNELTLMRRGPLARAEAKKLKYDFLTPRDTRFHMDLYFGNMRFAEDRVKRMMGSIRRSWPNLVIFNHFQARADIHHYQTYAKGTGRDFVLVDLTRSGASPELAERLYIFQGGVHIDNREGKPQEAARALLDLALS